jgi:hypothetical protein
VMLAMKAAVPPRKASTSAIKPELQNTSLNFLHNAFRVQPLGCGLDEQAKA